jgi:phospholipid/cholesterol/gamma-HCH transport system substrate-binding protein
MAQPYSPPPSNEAPELPPLGLKAALLAVLLLVLMAVSILYLLYARGAFETTQRLVLLADDSEGVVVGMDLTFSGFPIGRVRGIELSDEGKARIVVDVPTKDARWLRESSVFTLVRSLVGGTNIRAYSGILSDPPLKDGAVRTVLAGDATAEIPQVIAGVKELLGNLSALSSKDGALGSSLANLKTTTERLNGPRGALGVLTGNEADAKKIIETLDRTNALLARLDTLGKSADGLVKRTDGMVGKADAQVFGPDGLMTDVRKVTQELNAVLTDTRGSLKKLDAVLIEAQAVGANAKVATADLGTLRAEVESNLRKMESLINEINRKWPFKRDTEIKLP